jgi:HEAT repeat protein
LQVRCRAIEALGEIKEPGEVLSDRLIVFLKDSDSRIRMHAALALGKCRHTPAFSTLMESLGDSNHNVRGLSAWSLGNLGDERAVEALIHALEDDGESVRIYAYQALDAFGARALTGLEKARTHAEPSVRSLVERLIEDISSEGGEED